MPFMMLAAFAAGFALAAIVMAGIDNKATAQMMAAAKAGFFFNMVLLLYDESPIR